MTPSRISCKTAELLRRYADEYENSSFFAGASDPSWFMHVAKEANGSDENTEATAFVASCLSFGSIAQFVPKIGRIVELADGDVSSWIGNGKYRLDVKGSNECFYRFVTYADLRAFLDCYCGIMRRHGSLGGYVRERGDGTGLGAVRAICEAFASSGSRHLVPADAKSACKRICMFLRWMTRKPSPVDLGLWAGFIDRRTLIIPLDTHVVQEAVKLGLIAKGQSSMCVARRLTSILAEVFPEDPLKGDFALFGHGKASSR